jgi:hypothetical protein
MTGLTRKKLLKIVNELEARYRKCFAMGHGRTDFYRYLHAVYRVCEEWKAARKIKRRSARVAALKKVQVRANWDHYRILIAATSSANAKTSSMWARALRRAAAGHIDADEFLGALRKAGGPRGL